MTVYSGDAIELLAEMEDNTVDLVFTDPPYSSGARRDANKSSRGSMLRGHRWADDWFYADNMSTSGFLFLMRGVLMRSYDITKDGGHVAVWCDWRQLTNVMGICETSNWLVHNVIVWDKGHFGMGGVFRNQHEFIVVASKGSPPFVNRHNVPNVIQADRPDNSFHPTPKPIGLMAEVIDTLTPPGGLVLDPFAGSSSTGVAAQQVGREYVGIEISEGFAELGRQRLQQAALPLEPEPVASKP